MGNGVANGPDIEQAIRIIGSPTDLVTWLRGGLGQKMDQAILSIPAAYKSFADSQGYVPSDKPSDITNSLGTGGANSSRKPVNPALGSSANSIAGQYGFGPVTGGNNPSGTPDIPTQKAPQSQGVPVVVTLRSG